jgi:hypothetical protein
VIFEILGFEKITNPQPGWLCHNTCASYCGVNCCLTQPGMVVARGNHGADRLAAIQCSP